jgi:hypothetical protein
MAPDKYSLQSEIYEDRALVLSYKRRKFVISFARWYAINRSDVFESGYFKLHLSLASPSSSSRTRKVHHACARTACKRTKDPGKYARMPPDPKVPKFRDFCPTTAAAYMALRFCCSLPVLGCYYGFLKLFWPWSP